MRLSVRCVRVLDQGPSGPEWHVDFPLVGVCLMVVGVVGFAFRFLLKLVLGK